MSVSWGKEDSSFHAGGENPRGKKAAELVGTILPRIPPLHFAYMAVFIERMILAADKALAGDIA
jgi:hypothetical protein